ncbi:MAG: sigma 54-interacting transcriptional regulator, partial [Paracoccaceae bacterium]
PKPAQDLPLIGRSAPMQALYGQVARVRNADLPVLITGESGTGKSLLARAIHQLSDRGDQALVVLTGADLTGPDVPARGGTLVFDELADFDEAAQLRALRLMNQPGPTPPRIIATCQSDLAPRIKSGQFRADLFYRLSGVTLHLPALRDRVDDIALLAQHFLTQHATPRHLSDAAIQALRVFDWPGHVRQLENTIRRLGLLTATPEISRAEVDLALGPAPHAAGLAVDSGEKLADSVARHLQRYFDLHGGQLPPPGVYPRILKEFETPLIEIALAATGGNQAKCADLLGINRNTLRKKMTDLDIRVTRRRKLM